MNNVQEQMIIRKATRADARQIAEIVVEDWKNAYRGIIDDDYLDSMSVEERYQIELQRYQIYMPSPAIGKRMATTTSSAISMWSSSLARTTSSRRCPTSSMPSLSM